MLTRSTLFLCPITPGPEAHRGSAQDQFPSVLLHTFQQLPTPFSAGNIVEVSKVEPVLFCAYDLFINLSGL